MKSINLLKNLKSFNDHQTYSDHERDSPAQFSREPENEFSFSPEKSKQPTGGLAELLLKSARSKLEESQKKQSKSKSPLNSTKKKASPAPESFRPILNPNSLKLVKKAEKEGKDLHKKKDLHPQPQPDEPKPQKKVSIKEFLERNYNKELAKLEGKKKTYPMPVLDKVDSQCTFRPVVDLNSKAMANTHRVDLYELAVRKEEEKRSERMKELKKKEVEEMKQCTFTPKINKKIAFVQQESESRLTPDRLTYSKKYYKSFSPFS